MIQFLLGLPGMISGLFGSVNHITDAISNERIAKLKATTEEEHVRADENIKTLEARRDVMIAESAHSNINAIIRAVIALPVAIVLWKILAYDKALGEWTHGHTDALDPNLWNVVMVVIGFYFLYDASTAITRIFKSKS